MTLRNIIKKLNNKSYTRIPYSKIEKHNIQYDEEKEKYYL